VKKIYDEYELAHDLVNNVELYTKDQSRSKFLFQQRAGRITASRLKVAVCTDITQPAKSLVKSICYPETTKFYSKATCYGCEHEQIAYDAYKKKAISEHLNFSLSKSGLVIDPNYPFLGASPDGTIKCACCKPGVLEIKCPYSCQSESFLRKASESQFFLHELARWVTLSGCISQLLFPSSGSNQNLFCIILRFCGLARAGFICAENLLGRTIYNLCLYEGKRPHQGWNSS